MGKLTEMPAHTPGIKQGNSRGNYERMRGHKPDGTLHGRAVHRHRREGARADRPADAEPEPGVAGRVRQRPLLPAPSAPPRGCRSLWRAPRRSLRRRSPRSASRCASTVRAAWRCVRAARRAAPDRRAPPGLRLGRPRPAVRALRRARDWSTTLRTLPWTRSRWSSRSSPVARPSTSTSPAPTTSTWRRRATSRRSTKGRCRSSSCSAGPSSTRARAGLLQTAMIGWDQEAEFALPVRTGRRSWSATSPARAGCGSPRSGSTGSCLPLTQQARELGRHGRRAAARGRRLAMDPVRRIADAVLYEGYVLWPYRRSALKNQQRWTFGGVHPRAHSEQRAGDDPWVMQAQCLLEGGPGARFGVDVRFLHVVERQVLCEAGGRLEPVDELELARAPRHLAGGQRARVRRPRPRAGRAA